MQDRHRRYHRTLDGRFRQLKFKAKKRNLVMSLSPDQYRVLVQSPCRYCLGPLPEVGYGLDRKDSSVGYVLGNVVPCCGTCNSIKSDILTYNEMLFVMGQIRRLRAGKPNRT